MERTPPRILGPDGQPLTPASQGYGEFNLPPNFLFTAIVSGADKTNWIQRYDEAIRDSRADAVAMTRDPFLMALLNERARAVAARKWHLEVEDETDDRQLLIRDVVTKGLRRTPKLGRLKKALVKWTVWFGRYGEQLKWDWADIRVKQPGKNKETDPTELDNFIETNPDVSAGEDVRPVVTRRTLTIKSYSPIQGDKFTHTFDGTPCILVNGGITSTIPGAEILNTSLGFAVALRGTWRQQFILHEYDAEDGDFFLQYDQQEAIYGVGERSTIYWLNFERLELKSWFVTYYERVGLGTSVWLYDGANPNALLEAKKAAVDHSDKNNLFVPVFPDSGNRLRGAFERIETPTAGAEALRGAIEHIERQIERQIVGQAGSSKTEPGGFGGHQDEFQQATKSDITRMDAEMLDDTLSVDVVAVMVRNTFPEWPDLWGCCRHVTDLETVDPSAKLEAISKAALIGVTFKENEVRALTGMADPVAGDAVVGGKQAGPAGLGGEDDPNAAGDVEGNGKPKPGKGPFGKPRTGGNGSGNGKPTPPASPGRTEGQQFARSDSHSGKGRWITIGGSKGEDGKHHGGSPVYIENGRITKGAPGLAGKRIEALKENAKETLPKSFRKVGAKLPRQAKIAFDAITDLASKDRYRSARMDDIRSALAANGVVGSEADEAILDATHRNPQATGKLTLEAGGIGDESGKLNSVDPLQGVGTRYHFVAIKSDEAPESHRTELHREKGYQRAVRRKQARQEGINPDHLDQLAAEVLAHDKQHVAARVEMLRTARKQLEHYGYGWQVLNTGGAQDPKAVKAIDNVARSVADSYPEQFAGLDEQDAAERLLDMLKEGNPKAMAEPDAYEQALEHLREHKQEPEEEPVPFAEFRERDHPRDDDGTFVEKLGGIKMVRAPKGGAVSDVNGEHYKGGRWMPVHGLSEKKEKKPNGEAKGGVPPVAKEDAKRRQHNEPRQMTPEQIEEERERRERQHKWNELNDGPLGRIKWLGEHPNYKAMKGGTIFRSSTGGWKDFAEKIGADRVDWLVSTLEPIVRDKTAVEVVEMRAKGREVSADDEKYVFDQIRWFADNDQSLLGTKKHLKAAPQSFYAKSLLENVLEMGTINAFETVNEILKEAEDPAYKPEEDEPEAAPPTWQDNLFGPKENVAQQGDMFRTDPQDAKRAKLRENERAGDTSGALPRIPDRRGQKYLFQKPHDAPTLSAAQVLNIVKASPQFAGKAMDWPKYADRFGVRGEFFETTLPASTLRQWIDSGQLRTEQRLDWRTVERKARERDYGTVCITNEPGAAKLVVDGNHSLVAALRNEEPEVRVILPVDEQSQVVQPSSQHFARHTHPSCPLCSGPMLPIAAGGYRCSSPPCEGVQESD